MIEWSRISMPSRSAASRACFEARTLKARIGACEATASATSDSSDPADAGMDDAGAHLVGGQFFEGLGNRFRRTADIGLDDDGGILGIGRLQLRHYLFERAARPDMLGDRPFACLAWR